MMKSLSLAFAILATLASAFAPAPITMKNSALHMSEAPVEPTKITSPIVAALPAQSQSLPFLPRPAFLDGTLAGDVGFDPLGFAKSESDVMNYREAEIKHARLLHYWMYLGTYIGTYLPTSIPLELSDTFQHIPANPTKSVTL